MHKQVKAFYDMAFEYHIAAVTLWMQIVSAPYLYNPISYLLRHTIELQLKGLIVCELRKDNSFLKISEIKNASWENEYCPFRKSSLEILSTVMPRT